jgi:hypothetical protein
VVEVTRHEAFEVTRDEVVFGAEVFTGLSFPRIQGAPVASPVFDNGDKFITMVLFYSAFIRLQKGGM